MQTDSEITLLLCLMGVLLLTAIALVLVANRIGNIERQRSAEKKCPYCAELIKKDAVICRFCGQDLPIQNPLPQPVVIKKAEVKLPEKQPAMISVPEPVLQQAVIQTPVTQESTEQSSTSQASAIQPQKQTMGQSLKGLVVISLILVSCVIFGVIGQSLLKLLAPSELSALPFVMPTGDFEMSWDTYNSEYNYTLAGILTIHRQGSRYTQTIVSSDGSCGTTDLTVISEGEAIELTDSPGNFFGDYMVISSNGYLYFYDKQGVIYGVPPLDIGQATVTECVQPQAEHGKEINVSMSVLSVEPIGGNKVTLTIITNLPDGMELMMDVKDSGSYWAQDNVTVRGSRLVTTFENVDTGNYHLTITSPIVGIQPASVKAVLGENGKNMVGALVTFDQSLNSYFLEFTSNIEVK